MKMSARKHLVPFLLVIVAAFLCVPVVANALNMTYEGHSLSEARGGVWTGFYDLTLNGDSIYGMCDDRYTTMRSSWEADLNKYADIQIGEGKFNWSSSYYKSDATTITVTGLQKYGMAGWIFNQRDLTNISLLADINEAIWAIMSPKYWSSITAPSAKELYTSAQNHMDFDWTGVMAVLTPGSGVVSQEVLIANPVPEPATMLLLGVGLIGLAGLGRKKFKKNA